MTRNRSQRPWARRLPAERLPLMFGLALLAACTTVAPEPVDPVRPGQVILPGRETFLIDLLQPYWNAPKAPSLTGAKVMRTVVRIDADSGAGRGALVLRHASEVSPATGILVAGGPGGLDIDIQCPTCTSAGETALRQVADSIIARQRVSHAQIWSSNPDKRKTVPRPSPRTPRNRLLAVLVLTVVATTLAVLVRVRNLRRKAALKKKKDEAPPPAEP